MKYRIFDKRAFFTVGEYETMPELVNASLNLPVTLGNTSCVEQVRTNEGTYEAIAYHTEETKEFSREWVKQARKGPRR